MRVMEFIKLCCSMHFITQSTHIHTVVRDVRQTQTQALFARLPLFVVPNLSFFVSLWVPTLCDNIGVPVIICLISSLALSLYSTSTTTKISLRCDAKNFGFAIFDAITCLFPCFSWTLAKNMQNLCSQMNFPCNFCPTNCTFVEKKYV